MPTVTAQHRRRGLHPWTSVVGHLISQMLLTLFVFVAAVMLLGWLGVGPLQAGGEAALGIAVEVLVIAGCCAQAARRDPTIDQRWTLQLVVAGVVLLALAWWALTAWSGEPFDGSPGALLLDGLGVAVGALAAGVGVWWGQQRRVSDRRQVQGGR